MRALVIRGGFGIENLAIEERARPEPGPGQVLIKVGAASLNYRDVLVVNGLYNPAQVFPLIPASDGVGAVVAVGQGVTRAAVGDRVAPIFSGAWIEGTRVPPDFNAETLGSPHDGLLAEYAAFDQERVVKVPPHLTDAEAATLPCAGVTAWNALIEAGNLKAGETVLIQGTGGVSLFALQFAAMAGARAIVTSSSDAKLEKARALGASETINYRTTPEWGHRARELTGGEGVDHVVEIGGAGTLAQSLAAVRPGGGIYLIGFLAGFQVELEMWKLLMAQGRLIPIAVGSRAMFEAMNRAIALHALRPVVDRTFPIEQTAEALRHLESGAHFGKVVVAVS